MAATPQILGAATPPTATPPTVAPRPLSLQFTGSAAEYFRLWIVNLCLTLLTLGIFSAWAKVRKKRYFYSHTLLDGTPFQYLGQPLPILKGRILAVTLFGAWYVGTHYVISLLPVVLGLMVILAPWVLVRSAAFNARYSAFRNLTFEFKGSYWSAVKVLYGWAILTLLTLGIGFSWWQQRLKHYLITHYHYGGVAGEFSARGGQFFRVYFMTGLLFGGAVFALGLIAGFAAAGGGAAEPASREAGLTAFLIGFMIAVYALYAAAFAYLQARLGNLVWNRTALGPLKFESRLRARELITLYATNAVAIIASLGLLIPWATIRTLKYRIERFSVLVTGDLRQFQGSNTTPVQAAGAEVGEMFDFDVSL